MNALDMIAKAQAMPKTHKVTITYSDGSTMAHEERSKLTAENYANGFRRYIGKSYKSRKTGLSVILQSVEVIEL